MTETNPNPILVAVGQDPMDAALTFAVGEAARHSCGVHLLHVVHLLARGPEMSLAEETDLRRMGRQLLTRAVETARDLAPQGVEVTADLELGAVVTTLVEAAGADARMVVLQHRDLSRVRRVVTRSVTSGVAAHTRVPVVAVPATWSPGRSDTRTVTVGVDDPAASVEVLRTAAAAAASRSAVLRVVHTWDYPSAYDGIILTTAESEEWTRRTTAEIQAVLDTLEEDLTGVPVQIDAHRAPAADALVEASTHSDLLVIGRHDPVVPLGSHVGPVARAALRDAGCPVLLADPQSARSRRHGTVTSAAVAGD